MEDKIAKQISNTLKPLLIGLRNDVKKTNRRLLTLIAKRPPEIQKTKLTNPAKSLKIENFPEAIDLTPIQKEIQELKEIMTKGLKKQQSMGLKSSGLFQKWFGKILNVKVKNQIKLPKVLDVKVENQIEIPDLQRVFIDNRSPSEAIPVILTDRQGKAFYNAISTLSQSISANPPDSLWQLKTRNNRAFQTATDLQTFVGTTEQDFFLLRNGVASGVDLRLQDFSVLFSSGVAQARTTFRIYVNPTVTSPGTPLTIVPLKAGTPVATAFINPVIADRGTLSDAIVNAGGTVPFIFDLGKFILEGNDILITAQPSTNNQEHGIDAHWVEEKKE